MEAEIDTRHTSTVEAEVRAGYLAMYPQGDPGFVSTAFGWAVDCFSGKYRDYQPIDARYHDLEHTMQGTLCMFRILRGRHAAGEKPLLTQRAVELGLLAILLHDTGYLKTKDDRKGTGAKYTFTHVSRSMEFAADLLFEKGFTQTEILAVQNMIRCTGVNADLASIPFQSEEERMVGFALGTADLLGQMAARDYVSKLPVLYLEFAEALAFSPGRAAVFTSAEDLIQKTPLFWEGYVFPKVKKDFGGLHRFLNQPYPDGENPYVKRIEESIGALRNSLHSAERSSAT